MKCIITLLIKSYWKLIPPSKRKRCLFKESCSNYVYRINKEFGFVMALKSFVIRYRTCREGYTFHINEKHEYSLQLVDGTLISESEIAPDLIRVFKKQEFIMSSKFQ